MNIISNGLPGNSCFGLVVLTKNGNYYGAIISGANRGLFAFGVAFWSVLFIECCDMSV